MKLLHYLIIVPLALFAIWAVLSAEICPQSEGICFPIKIKGIEGFKVQSVLAVTLLFGYALGRIGAWFGYSPLRRDLRRQRKANRVLNKEHIKLNETVTGLKHDIIGIQEKAKKEIEEATSRDKQEPQNWWNRFKGQFAPKKGN
ncbi:MAG: hypothetical protein IKN71_01095 [Alphaproteobacteria bacterium]|nr:hypothetical protein [Alphaproteobacteria bacterium]